MIAVEGTMPAQTITLNLPAPLAQELSVINEEFVIDILARGLQQFKIERALDRYSQGGISFGAAAREADVSQAELARHAYARGLESPFSEQTLQEELR
jgi:hypothetical protein